MYYARTQHCESCSDLKSDVCKSCVKKLCRQRWGLVQLFAVTIILDAAYILYICNKYHYERILQLYQAGKLGNS